MSRTHISLTDVNLFYSSLAFRERSLGSVVKQALGRGRTTGLEDIHALRNVSVTIEQGDRVGIIGPNGSGKSTLLKTIAGLYPVQSGSLTVAGTIRHILDLMLGFEPEATGRDNIMYRGLLLGEKPARIKEMIDEIIDFADIGAFIDYPVKTYSAGMAIRLAFSVSTALPGEILLIDEVISAGDAEFMEKATHRFKKMVDGSGILVIASHDHHTLAEICNRGLIFKKGQIVYDGTFEDARNRYGEFI